MSIQVPGRCVGVCTAAADLSTHQFKFVKVTAAFAVNLTSVAGEAVYGVLQNNPISGQAAEIMRDGITKVVAGAAIAAGAFVMTNNAGKVITAATAANHRVGVALEAADDADDIVTIDLLPHAGLVPA